MRKAERAWITWVGGASKLAVLVVAAVSLGFAPGALAAGSGQITGTVTSASTAEPINGIEVCAYQEYLGGYGCTKTEPDGEYTIAALKPGEYKVEFSDRDGDFLSQFYDGKPASSEAQLVTVSAGQATSGIDADMQEGARITGKVTDASTQEAIDGIEACAISVSTGDAWCGTSVGLSGGYEIAQIPTGEYRIKFSPPFESGLNYFPQFYNGGSSSSETQVLSIMAGSLTPGVDAALKEGGRVNGVVRDAATQVGLEGIEVCAHEAGGEDGPCTKTNWAGEYSVPGLASGEYKLVFYPLNRNYLVGETAASVTAGSTTYEIDVGLVKGGQVTGRVTDAATQQAISNVQVCALEVGSEPGAEGDCATSGPGGEYTISQIASGEYEIAFSPSVFEDLDYFFYDGPTVLVTAGETTSGVDAALTEGGRITGRITSASTGEPIEGAEACAREVGGDGEQCGTANANGEYTILRLNGQYRLEFRSRGGGYLAQLYGGEPPLEHTRLVFSPAQELSVTAPGTVSEIDAALQPGTFVEPVNTTPPAISGTAAVGSVLSCSPGSWTGDPAPTAFTYRWLRDGAPITGPTAAESSYTAQSADEGHGVACEVYATNAAGREIGTGYALSASVTIGPAVSTNSSPGGQGGAGGTTPPAETMTGALSSAPLSEAIPLITVMTSSLTVSGNTAPVSVECQAAACRGSIELTVQGPVKNGHGKTAADHKTTIVLATGFFSLVEGNHGTVVLHLTAAGRKRLAHASKYHPIAAKLTLSIRGGKTATRSVLAV